MARFAFLLAYSVTIFAIVYAVLFLIFKPVFLHFIFPMIKSHDLAFNLAVVVPAVGIGTFAVTFLLLEINRRIILKILKSGDGDFS